MQGQARAARARLTWSTTSRDVHRPPRAPRVLHRRVEHRQRPDQRAARGDAAADERAQHAGGRELKVKSAICHGLKSKKWKPRQVRRRLRAAQVQRQGRRRRLVQPRPGDGRQRRLQPHQCRHEVAAAESVAATASRRVVAAPGRGACVLRAGAVAAGSADAERDRAREEPEGRDAAHLPAQRLPGTKFTTVTCKISAGPDERAVRRPLHAHDGTLKGVYVRSRSRRTDDRQRALERDLGHLHRHEDRRQGQVPSLIAAALDDLGELGRRESASREASAAKRPPRATSSS